MYLELQPSRLRDVMRILFLLPVPVERLVAGPRAILGVALAAALVPSLYGLVDYAGDGMASTGNVPEALVLVVYAALLALFVSWATRHPDAFAPLLFATLAAWAIIDLAALVAWEAMRASMPNMPPLADQAFFFLPLLWPALALGRFALPLAAGQPWRRLPAALAALFLVALPMALTAPERSLWVKDWSRDMAQQRAPELRAASEAAIYAQPKLLEAALDAVEPGRKGVVDVFFVGVAGYGRQDVFLKEVRAVKKLMEERFDAGGRTVALLNNPATVMEAPIASMTAIRAALARVAARMDRDEDVLVLFLTSHGDAEHRFSLDLPPIRFDRLDPAVLRGALDASGIRNRVVIVSACYSGGFAKPLADAHTLVMTASAPDRNSFGCSNEAEWTYFGRAYFDEALRNTHSFREAFLRALPVIAEREAAERFTPSNPTMAGGEALEAPLKRLEARLAQATATAASDASTRLR